MREDRHPQQQAAIELGFFDERTFDRVIDPPKTVKRYMAAIRKFKLLAV